MPKIKAPRKPAQRIVIISTFFLLLSIPLVIFGLLQDNLDIRNRAYEEIEVSKENPCVISFPYVNPYSLEAGKTFTVQVEAETPDSNISNLKITDSSGNSIYTENFENQDSSIYTSFKYTPEKSGQIDLLGLIETSLGNSYACQISSPYDILGLRVVSNNSKPTFTSNASASKPSQAIVTNDNYEYTLTATDTDEDNINYSYSFTPEANWLKPVIVEDGSNGKLTIKFSGSTNKPASYLANVIIHDGYSKHISTQSWVISVSPEENDIPSVNILSPLESLRLDKGDTFKAKWDATDLNQITKYQLYLASNPTDESSWKTVNDNISYKTTEYTVETSSLTPGTYKLIARAVDNQDPAAIGMDISDEIVISGTTTDTDSDDQALLDQPQVTNMSPSSTEEVTNPRATIKAAILASVNSKLLDTEGNITFKVDDLDKTADLKINKLSENAYTLIYQPQEDLTAGLHKIEIYIKDSGEKEATKSWTFNLTVEEDTSTGLISIFGYDISQRTIIIIAGGLLLLILAIVAPIIIIKVWKDDKEEVKESSKLPPTTPEDTTQYQPLIANTELKDKVDTTPTVENTEPDVWDKYSTLKPEEQTENIENNISSDTTPEELPDESKQSTDLAMLEGKQEETKPLSEEEFKPTPMPEPKLKEQTVITEEKPLPTPEPVVVEEETTPISVQPEIPEPSAVDLEIPEPEIPSFDQTPDEEEQLKQLYSQIQQVQEEEKKKQVPNS